MYLIVLFIIYFFKIIKLIYRLIIIIIGDWGLGVGGWGVGGGGPGA